MLNNQFILTTIILVLISVKAGADGVIELRGQTMGTSYSIKYTGHSEAHSRKTIKLKIDSILEQINDQMSTWRPSSELSRFNKAQAGQWFNVSRQTAEVAMLSKDIYSKSSHAFDVTVGRIVNLWGFGPDKTPTRSPSLIRLKEALENNGTDKLKVRLSPPALKKSNKFIYVDFSGIAKGYGVDQVADYLEYNGINNYLVEIGGELRTRGKKGRLDWKVAIEKPSVGKRAIQRIITPKNMGMATSGDYRNFFVDKNGRRRSHIIDPRYGKPVTHKLVSVTVLDNKCATADAMATALMVLGESEGVKIAKNLGLKALFIVKTSAGFKEIYTGDIENHLVR